MELFKIQCTTCLARLKVFHREAIGQILTCPKCESMVQVIPPPGWTGSTDIEIALFSEKPEPTQPTQAAEHSRQGAIVAVPPPLPNVRVPSIAPSVHAAVGPVIVNEGRWSPLLQRLARDRWMLGGSLAGGVVLGSVIWFGLLGVNGNEHGPQPVAAAIGAAGAKSVTAAPTSDSPHVTNLSAELKRSKPSAPDTATHSTTPPTSPRPLGESRLASTVATVEARATPPEHQRTVNLPGPVVDAVTESTVAAPIANAEEVEPTPSETTSPTMEATIRARLGEPLSPIDFEKVPLVNFLDFLAQLTTLDIKLDRPALVGAGKRLDAPVTLKMQGSTVEDALREALAAHGLVFVIREGAILVTVR